MSTWLYVLGTIVTIVLLLLLVIASTQVTVNIVYNRKGKYDHLSLEFFAWFRLIKIKYELPQIKLQTEGIEPHLVGTVTKKLPTKHTKTKKKITLEKIKRWKRKYERILKRVGNLKPIMVNMLRHVYCEHLEWHTILGAGEANTTGTLTGLVWGLKNVFIGAICQYVTLRTVPRTSIQPVWNEAKVQTEVRCILRFRVGYAIVAGVRILLNLRKGREQIWQNTPSKA